MKLLKLNDKSQLIRHWGVWYRVDRNGTTWQKLKPVIVAGKPLPKDPIAAAASSLKQAKPLA